MQTSSGVSVVKWVTIKKLSELIGYSEHAIRAKIKKGVWRQGPHWTKAADGRILMNLPGIEAWIERRVA
jgi:hypothetical protein